MRQYVRGINLDRFPGEMADCRLLVTFFGSGFDLPVLRRSFPELPFDVLHIDLCFALKRLGYSGGLKHVETALGITRGQDTAGLSGWMRCASGTSTGTETVTRSLGCWPTMKRTSWTWCA